MNPLDIAKDIAGYGTNGSYSNSDPVKYLFLTKSVNGLAEILSLILGYTIIVVEIAIAVIVALEIAYLAFPVIRGRLDVLRDSKKRRIKQITGLCLRDAIRALEKSARDGTFVWTDYLVMKIKVLILSAIMILLLMNITTIINFSFNIARSIISPFVG